MIEARRLPSWQSLALIQLPSSSMIADLSQNSAAVHRQMSPRVAQQLELGSLSHIHGDSWGPHGDPWGVEGQWRPMGTAWGPREDPAGTHGDPMWTHGDPMGTHGGGHGDPWGHHEDPRRGHGGPWGPMGAMGGWGRRGGSPHSYPLMGRCGILLVERMSMPWGPQ